MDALTALHTRNSVNLLTEPAPNAQQLDNIFQAAVRACDHRNLTPWQFLVIAGDARHKFGELLAQVQASVDGQPLEPTRLEKIKSKPLRAPMVVVVVANVTEHPKVPEIEQVLSAGAAAQMMMVAAHAQGIGAIWRSGQLMFHPATKQGLGLQPSDQIVGFIYLGTPVTQKPISPANAEHFVTYWD